MCQMFGVSIQHTDSKNSVIRLWTFCFNLCKLCGKMVRGMAVPNYKNECARAWM